jgi:hypothetical protein
MAQGSSIKRTAKTHSASQIKMKKKLAPGKAVTKRKNKPEKKKMKSLYQKCEKVC